MKHFLTSIFIFFILSSNAQEWTQMNDTILRGGFVVQAPHHGIFSNDSVIILATVNGVYRSIDMGMNWNFSADFINNKGLGPNAIAKLDNKPYLLVNYTDLYYSNDNGLTWILKTLNGIPAFTSLGLLSSIDSVLYLFTSSGTSYKSFDGDNWVVSDNIFSIGSDSLSWVQNGIGIGLENKDSLIKYLPALAGSYLAYYDLAMEPKGTTIYCANKSDNKIYRYDISGNDSSWTLASSFPFSIPAYTGYGPTYSLTFVASNDALLLSLVGESITGKRFVKFYRSVDNASTWTELIDSGIKVPIVLMSKAINDSTTIINNSEGDLFFSFDKGQHWEKRQSHFIDHYEQNLITMENSLILKISKNGATTSNPGVLKSEDNGTTWHRSNNGLVLTNDFEYDSSEVNGNYDFLFKSGNVLFCTRQPSYIARSFDEAETWDTVSAPVLPLYYIYNWYRGDENSFFIIEAQDTLSSVGYITIYKYFRTNDNGNSWQEVSSINTLDHTVYGMPARDIVGKNDTMIAFHQDVISGSPIPRFFVYQSNDNGSTWVDVSTDIFSNSVLSVDYIKVDANDKVLIDFDSTANKFMAVLTSHDTTTSESYWGGVMNDTLYMYASGVWTKINSTGLPGNIDITAIKFNNGVWNIGSNYGVFTSSDDGLTWESGVGEMHMLASQNKTLSSDGLYEGMKITTISIKNSDAFLSTYSSGCWTNATTITTDLKDKDVEEFQFFVYPNPSSGDYVNLVSRTNVNHCTYEVYNITGNLLKQKTLTNIAAEKPVSVDMSQFSSGLYFMKIQTDKNIYKEKLVITK